MDKFAFEERFRHYLKQSHCSQARLARALHVSRTTVNKWITTENRIAYEQLHAVCHHLAVPDDERAAFFALAGYTRILEEPPHPATPQPVAAAPPDPEHTPYAPGVHNALLYTAAGNIKRPTKLFGRATTIEQVNHLLDLGQHVLLTGLGGTGKTALAATIADLRTARGHKTLWLGVQGEDADSIFEALLMPLDGQDLLIGKRGEALVQQVQTVLSQAAIRLVVLDDVWEPRMIQQVRLAMPDGVPLLMTSRLDSANVDCTVAIAALESTEAVALLDFHTQPSESATSTAPTPPSARRTRARDLLPHLARSANEDAAHHLCAKLGNHPLGIVIAGAWLKQNRRRPHELLQRIVESDLTPFTVPIPESFAEDGRETVKQVFDQTYKGLKARTKALFRLFGYLAQPQASAQLLAACLEEERWTVEEWLEELVMWNLAQREEGDIYTLHAMVHDYARILLPRDHDKMHKTIIDATTAHVRKHATDHDLLEADLANLLYVASIAADPAALAIITPLALDGYLDHRGHTRQFLIQLDRVIAYLTQEQTGSQRSEAVQVQLHHLLSKRGNTHFDRAEYRDAVAGYEAALAAAYDETRAIMLTALIAKAHSFGGQRAAAQQRFQEASTAARATGDDLLLSFVLEQEAHAAGQRGDHAAAYLVAREQVAINEKLLAEAEDANRLERLFRSLINLGTARLQLAQDSDDGSALTSPSTAAQLNEALALHHRAVEIAGALDSDELLAHAYWALGEDYHVLADRAEASHYLHAAHQLYAAQGKIRDHNIVATFLQEHGY